MKPSKRFRAKIKTYSDWKKEEAIPYLHMKGQTACKKCKGRFLLDIDHIIPRSKAPNRVMDLTNINLLCRNCHNQKTKIERRDWFNYDLFMKGEYDTK